jgi:hypothetical protein
MKAMPMKTCKPFCEIFNRAASYLSTRSARACDKQLNTSFNPVTQSAQLYISCRLRPSRLSAHGGSEVGLRI